MYRPQWPRRPRVVSVAIILAAALPSLLFASAARTQGAMNALTGLGSKPEVGTYRPREVPQPKISSSGSTEIFATVISVENRASALADLHGR